MTSTTVAACVITKNRRDALARMLSNVRGQVDHVYVYDTGSSDGTIEMLEAMDDVTVERGEWRDDFAWAREQSFAMAGDQFDWLVWMDDDERHTGYFRKIANWADHYGLNGVNMKRRDPIHGDATRIRLVRSDADWRWRGFVFEWLESPRPMVGDWTRSVVEHHKTDQRETALYYAQLTQADRDRTHELPERVARFAAFELVAAGCYSEAAEAFQIWFDHPAIAAVDEQAAIRGKLHELLEELQAKPVPPREALARIAAVPRSKPFVAAVSTDPHG